MAFVIAHITDTHLAATKDFFVDNFEIVAAHIRANAPDLVVNTGDVSVNGADLREDLTAARALHDAIGVPWIAVPGNHDVGDNQEIARKQPIDAARRARWREVFGPDFWVRDVPGWRLLGVNSLMLSSDLAEAAEQEAFIGDAAAGLGERKLALFLHKPLFHDTLEDAEISSHGVNPGARAILLKLLGGILPTLVCCGHLHEYRERAAGPIHQIWGPATSFTISDWFLPTHGGVHMVGYVRIALEADGTFESKLVEPAGLAPLDLADFPQAYGDLRVIKAEIEAKRLAAAAG